MEPTVICSVRNSFGTTGDHFGMGGTTFRLATKVACRFVADGKARRFAGIGPCSPIRVTGLGSTIGSLHSRMGGGSGRLVGTGRRIGTLRDRLGRYHGGIIPIRAIMGADQVPRSVVAFQRNGSIISTSRLPGMRQMTSCVGGRIGAAIIVGKCTSPRKGLTFGRGLTGTHTRTVGAVLIGGCGVSTTQVATRNRKVNSVFSRPS